MNISVIIPAYNAANDLPYVLDSLSTQTNKNFEIIVVDDFSTDATSNFTHTCSHTMLRMLENHGPACCRNAGAKKASGEILAFTDSDCLVDRYWLEKIQHHFDDEETDAIMGKLTLLPSTYLGDSISALGFPAGGSIGFEKIWKVDKNGLTDSLSSCNCALRRDIFFEIGGFDESFPYAGGEDSFLAYGLRKSNYKIKYCPDVIVHHPARDSLNNFIKWQYKRGVSSYIFSKKVTDKKKFLSLRLWSTQNILMHYKNDIKFPLIFLLLVTSFITQLSGLLFAKYFKDYS